MITITHVEITYPLGRRALVPVMAYVAMTLEQLAGTKVRTMTRAEHIARRVKERRGS